VSGRVPDLDADDHADTDGDDHADTHGYANAH
jgi:hypothetical protein